MNLSCFSQPISGRDNTAADAALCQPAFINTFVGRSLFLF